DVWDTLRRRVIRTYALPPIQGSHGWASSPDGTSLLIAGPRLLTLYDAETAHEKWRRDISGIIYVHAFNHAGTLIGVGRRGAGRVSLLDVRTGEEIGGVDASEPDAG